MYQSPYATMNSLRDVPTDSLATVTSSLRASTYAIASVVSIQPTSSMRVSLESADATLVPRVQASVVGDVGDGSLLTLTLLPGAVISPMGLVVRISYDDAVFGGKKTTPWVGNLSTFKGGAGALLTDVVAVESHEPGSLAVRLPTTTVVASHIVDTIKIPFRVLVIGE